MKFTSITYRRLESVERFRNIAVEATVALEDGDDPDASYEELRRWVDDKAIERRRKIEGTLDGDDEAGEDRVAAGPIHFPSGGIPAGGGNLGSASIQFTSGPAGQPPPLHAHEPAGNSRRGGPHRPDDPGGHREPDIVPPRAGAGLVR